MTIHTLLPPRVVAGYAGRDEHDPAVLAALELRRQLDLELEVVHAVPRPRFQRGTGHLASSVDEYERLESSVEARASALFGELLRAHGDDPGGSDLLRFVAGAPATALIDRAAEWPADLVVLGPHARRGHIDFGGTARTVLGKSPCNVWTQPGAPRRIRHVLVPVDVSEHSLAALRLARALGQVLEARLTVLHAYIPPFFSYSQEAIDLEAATSLDLIESDRRLDVHEFDELLADFEWGDVAHEVEWHEGRPDELVLAHPDVDLVVMGTHGRSGIAPSILGSVAYEVLRRSEVPVLAVHQPKRRIRLGD